MAEWIRRTPPPSCAHAANPRDEQFTSYKTAQYRLHLYETLTGFKFVLLSDPSADSLRFVLRQIHTGPFVEYVVRNPLVEMDSRTQGIDNDQVSGSPSTKASSWRNTPHRQ
jgi:hypothetical protein